MDWTQLDTKSIHCVGWIQARNRAVESTLFRLGSKRKTKYVSRQQHVNLLGFLKKYQYWYVAPRYPHLCCSCNATMPIDLQGWCSGRRGILNGNGVIPTVARPLDHHWTIIGLGSIASNEETCTPWSFFITHQTCLAIAPVSTSGPLMLITLAFDLQLCHVTQLTIWLWAVLNFLHLQLSAISSGGHDVCHKIALQEQFRSAFY